MLDQNETLYDQIYEDLQETENEQQFVGENYLKFISLQKEKDQLYKEYLTLPLRIQQQYQQIEEISREIERFQVIKQECIERLESQDIIIVQEDVQAEDQMTEMIDNLTSCTFEKDYVQAMDYYKLLKEEMLKSPKYIQILKKQDIRDSINKAYRNLAQSMLADLQNENQASSAQGKQQPQKLVEYLLQLEQYEDVMITYLSIQEKRLNEWIQKQGKFTEQLTSEFINHILQINNNFEKLFQPQLKSNQFMFSYVAKFNRNQVAAYYSQQLTFQQEIVTFEELFQYPQSTLNVFSKYGQKGQSLDFDIQKEIVINLELQISNLFNLYGSKIFQLIQLEENKLVYMYHLPNLLKYDELFGDQLNTVNFKEFKQQPQELKAKSTHTVKSIFEQLCQPVSISAIYFWNFIYRLGDLTLNFMNPKEYPLLSIQVMEVVQKMIFNMIEDYSKVCQRSKADSKKQSLFQVGVYFGNFNMCSTLSSYLQNRAAYVQFPSNPEWKKITQIWFVQLQQAIIRYYQYALLDNLIQYLLDLGMVYTQKNTQQSPSLLFQVIIYVFQDVSQSLQFVLPKAPLNHFLSIFLDYIIYLFEYSLYWNHHNLGKNKDVFFMAKEQRDLLDMTQINLTLSTKALKVSHLTVEGINQLIIDFNFLLTIYQKLGIQVQTQFLEKLVKIYMKERKADIEFNLQQKCEVKLNLEQAKTYIERRSINK